MTDTATLTPLMLEVLDYVRDRYESISLPYEAIERFEQRYVKACNIWRKDFLWFEEENIRSDAAPVIAENLIRVVASVRDDLLNNELTDTHPEVQGRIRAEEAGARITVSILRSFADLGYDLTAERNDAIPTPLDSKVLAQITAQAIARVGNALSRRGEFVYTSDRSSIIHQPMNETARTLEPLAVVIAPLDTRGEQRYFPPEEIGEIHQKLLSIGSNVVAAFAIVMSCAIVLYRTFLSLVDFMKRLGLNPRSVEERKEYRRILWHSIQIFSQTSVVGNVTGRYKDVNGDPIKYIGNSPVIVVTGTYDEQNKKCNLLTLRENDEAPAMVGFTAGDFFYRHRSNRKMLTSIGDLQRLKNITPGKPSGQWAQTLTLSLNQYWRENASDCEFRYVGEGERRHVTVAFKKKTTRRELFERYLPDPNPFEILEGNDPSRARKYWEGAAQELLENKIAVFIGKASPLKRYGWGDTWLNDTIEPRPHHENRSVMDDLQKIRSGAKKFNQNKGRRRRKKEELSESS
jgi:hypothetical protein